MKQYDNLKVSSISSSLNFLNKSNQNNIAYNKEKNNNFDDELNGQISKYPNNIALEIEKLIQEIDYKIRLIYEYNLKNNGLLYYDILSKIDFYYQSFIKLKNVYNNENKLKKLNEINNSLEILLEKFQNNKKR